MTAARGIGVAVVSVRPSAAAVAAVGVYALMWLGHQQAWGWLDSPDAASLSTLYDVGVQHPEWVRFWQVLCTVLGPAVFRVLAAVAAVIALVRRSLRTAAFLFVTVELSGLLIQAAKGLADRPRPATALVTESSSSFPSGHALGVLVGVLALLTVVWPMLSRPLAVAAGAAGAVVVLAVGFGRVALNVHHLSDVLAGWALGYLYFLACAWLLRR
ncbi:hypothetical protein A5707_03205 [Mycobacterium kyorinense]|uniref:Phosphatidic acid phosphatase type 2/haloperoxidase domain-containing protein n=1 Tax=Mycobacterium kyorinense TaxID=487514 RepID=A0A1A2Z512_9MYCO|nr:phosphatase PAP2 family protein [Mycobacterium kyorinense]OBI44552.1 hypothetical protein A5707_03205 [Mycobacterium kyorinense]